MGLGKAQVLC